MKYAYVLASDKNQLDLAKNVMERLDRVSNYPVAFSYVDNGWFDKPKAVRLALESGYEAVCWLDNDIQILSNFDEIFETNTPVAGVPDYLYPFCLNAGVLVIKQEAMDLVLDWEFYTDTGAFRSDQEALHFIRQQKPEAFSELPMLYNHQKWAIKNGISINDDTKIVHWTGDDGKAYLRS